MKDGRRLEPSPSLDAIREHVTRELARLPEPLRRLEDGTAYPVEVSAELVSLAAEVDRRMEERGPGA
jgi:nicotinate phosphoribosyltransferase